jgi:hypothetical protein
MHDPATYRSSRINTCECCNLRGYTLMWAILNQATLPRTFGFIWEICHSFSEKLHCCNVIMVMILSLYRAYIYSSTSKKLWGSSMWWTSISFFYTIDMALRYIGVSSAGKNWRHKITNKVCMSNSICMTNFMFYY